MCATFRGRQLTTPGTISWAYSWTSLRAVGTFRHLVGRPLGSEGRRDGYERRSRAIDEVNWRSIVPMNSLRWED